MPDTKRMRKADIGIKQSGTPDMGLPALAMIPLCMLCVAIGMFLIGCLLWYAERSENQRAAYFLGFQLVACSCLAIGFTLQLVASEEKGAPESDMALGT
ncbi:hypothetical protein ASPWEDRAFT_177879 [Aspergillus wentii DTO 134E9]|uniref:Uncharacterized protein n=1 Tax=Aspergillus wentii DTO 134E9 TaxID=1073089 RepID=A0A1L9R3X0_ASPWE|nr:uncharacterized protein ASPWEDRAFT_177879 [Aspergillus wentii DTO 134E9]OJJ29573.1 hypothetical protein ASPWEDRAFT_177879 [Aspergillus wentii DTO 134E9]